MSDQNQTQQSPTLTTEQRLTENRVGMGKWINITLLCFCVLLICIGVYFIAGAAVSGVTGLGGLVWVLKGATVG